MVEGDTDLRLLKLAAQLSGATQPLLAGLQIGLIGTTGRGGGTSRLRETIAREYTLPEWDLLLFDNDQSGREAAALTTKLGQRHIILPQQLAVCASEANIEIEDLHPWTAEIDFTKASASCIRNWSCWSMAPTSTVDLWYAAQIKSGLSIGCKTTQH